MNKIKLIGILFLAVAISACSTTGTNRNYDVKGKRFFVSSVDVDLMQKCDVEGFSDGKGLAEEFKNKISKALSDKDILASSAEGAVSLQLDIKYKRTFMGELFGACKTYGAATFQYTGIMSESNHVVASIETDELVPNFGGAGNFGAIFKQLGGAATGDSNTELEEKGLDVMSRSIVDRLYLFQYEDSEPSSE